MSPGSEAAAWAGGVAVLLGLIGGGIKWMVTWLSGRNDARVGELIAETKSLRNKVESLDAKLMFLGSEIALLLSVTPEGTARERAAAALRAVFPISPSIPAEFAALLAKLDGDRP